MWTWIWDIIQYLTEHLLHIQYHGAWNKFTPTSASLFFAIWRNRTEACEIHRGIKVELEGRHVNMGQMIQQKKSWQLSNCVSGTGQDLAVGGDLLGRGLPKYRQALVWQQVGPRRLEKRQANVAEGTREAEDAVVTAREEELLSSSVHWGR